MLEKYRFFDSEKFNTYFDRNKYLDLSFSKYRKVYESKGHIIKIGRISELDREVVGLKILGGKGLAPILIDEFKWKEFHVLVMEKVEGKNLIHKTYLGNPIKFIEEYARCLYHLHHEIKLEKEIIDDLKSRFIDNKMEKIGKLYNRNAICNVMISKNYNMSIDEGILYIRENYFKLINESIIHGDVCLPNIIFKEDKFSRFIDLDGFEVYDYHYDIFWALWTLLFNLETDEYRDVFIKAYGRELIDEKRLKLCGIISCLLSETNMKELI